MKGSVHTKRKLNKFLGNVYPHVDFSFAFQSIKRIGNIFPLKIMSPVICARQLFTSLRVVVARLLIMAKCHAILLFTTESIWEQIKGEDNQRHFLHPLETLLEALAIVPL